MLCQVAGELAGTGLRLTLPSLGHGFPVYRFSRGYPQDAQSAVEMLIIQRSQIAAFSGFGALAPCPERPYIPSCAEHGAGVGRSSTGRLYGAARKSRSGKSVGAVDETATDSATFFGPPRAAAPWLPARLGSPRCTRPVPRASTRA